MMSLSNAKKSRLDASGALRTRRRGPIARFPRSCRRAAGAGRRRSRRQPHRQEFHPQESVATIRRADGEHVGIVVLARQPRRVQIIAQRRARAGNLVGRHLLTLAASAEDDPAIGTSFGDLPRHVGADRRVVDRRIAERAAVVDRMPEPAQRRRSGAVSARIPRDPRRWR